MVVSQIGGVGDQALKVGEWEEKRGVLTMISSLQTVRLENDR